MASAEVTAGLGQVIYLYGVWLQLVDKKESFSEQERI